MQEIVRIANEFGVPLSPISTGKNNGYGGGQPRLSGAVVVDTGERMNRILEVNEKLGYALLEPGVSYFDLYDYLQANAPTLMLDCPDLGWGSVVGNTLDRGRRLHPIRRPPHVADRAGGRAADRRRDAHRHGRGARAATPGSCSPTASAPTRTACSPSRTWASSPRWASR